MSKKQDYLKRSLIAIFLFYLYLFVSSSICHCLYIDKCMWFHKQLLNISIIVFSSVSIIKFLLICKVSIILRGKLKTVPRLIINYCTCSRVFVHILYSVRSSLVHFMTVACWSLRIVNISCSVFILSLSLILLLLARSTRQCLLKDTIHSILSESLIAIICWTAYQHL